jgi:phosphate transport system protein
MPREQFEQDLQDLKDELLLLSSMSAEAVHKAVEALQSTDTYKARKIIEADAAINRKRFAIEDACLTLIATQQPMARDMRLLAAILEIAGELERIGDYGKGIGRIIIYMNGNRPIKKLVDIPKMETIAHTMLDKAMTAFVNGDVVLAASVPSLDDQVDDLYNLVYRELLEMLLVQPEAVEQANHLLWAAHNLERYADRTINICERVRYMCTGVFQEADTLEFGISGVN